MIDHLFTAVLAFCVLAAGTLAVGSAMFDTRVEVVTLPQVTVIGKRAPAPRDVAVARNEQAASTKPQ